MNKTAANVNGVLFLNKPLGPSSNQVLQKVKRIFKAKKAGHTGCLDPLATGMLPIVFGEATKFSQFMLDATKGYTAVGVLGKNTTTQDVEGEVIRKVDPSHIKRPHLLDALSNFKGKQKQIPSMYSALKHNGVPLYKLARQGIEVERKAREIDIAHLELLDFAPPFFTIKVVCSKGTYIRNLVEDIGELLQVGAYVDALHRDFVGPFVDEQMYTFQEIYEVGDKQSLLLPANQVCNHLPRLNLTPSEQDAIFKGQLVDLTQYNLSESQLFQLFGSEMNFLGIGEAKSKTHLKAKRLCVQTSSIL